MDAHARTIRAGEMHSHTGGIERLYTEKLSANQRPPFTFTINLPRPY